jgi:hypothetical protein
MSSKAVSILASAAPAAAKRWLVPTLSAIGAILGIAGTGVLALAPEEVSTVFVLYLISNLAWITVAIRTRQPWLLLMNAVYMSLGIVGLLR